MLPVTKAHAYGNDFLFVPAADAAPFRASGGLADLARRLCHRHNGVGADGLILFELQKGGASMQLLNADGSASELSGNGMRCLAALAARAENVSAGATVVIHTDAGVKPLELRRRDGERYTFCAAMGTPEDLRVVDIPVAGESIRATVLRMGNPQCVVLGPLPDQERFLRIGRQLSTHAMFPAGTNVEFAHVEAPGRVQILIWERGVGPTTSSGTGSSAAGVAAAAHGGAARSLDVVAPGGTQRVEWRDDGVYLTGWAEILMDGQWIVF